MFGKWMTKLGAVLIGIPPILDALTPVVPPKVQTILQGIGWALAALGIRRAIK